jgi:succinate dehydrogenase / fumarate reductase iron-sulfur subunit
MTAQPRPTEVSGKVKSRARVVKVGRLPVSEFAFDRAGAASPFGDDVTFPLPPERLIYERPED